MDRARLRRILPAFFPVALLAAAWAALTLTRDEGAVASVWPVNGLVVAFLVRWPREPWQKVYVLLSAAVAIQIANLAAGMSLAVATALTCANMIEVALAALILTRFPDPTAGLKPVLAFLGGAVLLAPALGGAVAAVLLTLAGEPAAFGPTAYRWFVASGLGMGIVGAFLLTIGRHTSVVFDRRAMIRFFLAQAAVVAVSTYLFLLSDRPPLFMIAPFVVAAAMSHSQFGGVMAVVIAAVLALVGVHLGTGTAAVAALFGAEPLPLTRLLLASLIFTILPVSALLRRLETYALELEDRRAKAEALNEIKTRLLAHVSHEIRSPLAGVTSLAELMRDGALGELTPSQREMLGQIAASGAQVTDLAQDLTDAAAIQAGKARVAVTAVSVREAITSAVETANHRVAPFGAKVEVVAGEADDHFVAADPRRLRQILVNLLVNGAKYGGRPPLVRIEARVTPNGSIRFEVSDNGSGIDSVQRERLFQDFERLGAEKGDLEGAGLGLALSKQIAQLQAGELDVEAGDLGGARFWLQLPQFRQEADAA